MPAKYQRTKRWKGKKIEGTSAGQFFLAVSWNARAVVTAPWLKQHASLTQKIVALCVQKIKYTNKKLNQISYHPLDQNQNGGSGFGTPRLQQIIGLQITFLYIYIGWQSRECTLYGVI